MAHRYRTYLLDKADVDSEPLEIELVNLEPV